MFMGPEMELLSRNSDCINVHGCSSQKSKVLQELGVNLGRDLVGIGNCQFRNNCDVEFSKKLVPQPASSDFRYLFDPRNVSGGVSQFFQDVRLNTVQCPQHHVFSALINDSQNCNRNQQSDNGICFCESEV